jgi:hypothetical protein
MGLQAMPYAGLQEQREVERPWSDLPHWLLPSATPVEHTHTYAQVGFYCLFHLWLNILAEVLHFGDREFYKVGQCSKNESLGMKYL